MGNDPTFPRRKVLEVYQHTRSIRQTNRMLFISRNKVRSIVGRRLKEGKKGLKPRNRKPYRSPRKTRRKWSGRSWNGRWPRLHGEAEGFWGQLRQDKGIQFNPVPCDASFSGKVIVGTFQEGEGRNALPGDGPGRGVRIRKGSFPYKWTGNIFGTRKPWEHGDTTLSWRRNYSGC